MAGITCPARTSAPWPPPVLRHRIITNFNAEAEGIKPDDVVRKLIDLIPRDPNETTDAAAPSGLRQRSEISYRPLTSGERLDL